MPFAIRLRPIPIILSALGLAIPAAADPTGPIDRLAGSLKRPTAPIDRLAGSLKRPTAPIDRLTAAVTVNGILSHLYAFQGIADAHGGAREAGSAGNAASIDYVAGRLQQAGYRVSRQEFEFPHSEVLAPGTLERIVPEPRAYIPEVDFLTAENSSSAELTASIQAVDVQIPPAPTPSSTSGCEAEDFVGFVPGRIALIQRGTCDFDQKVAHAVAAGAAGVLLFNEGQPERADLESFGIGAPQPIPVLSTSFAVGEELHRLAENNDDVSLHLTTQVRNEQIATANLIAETRFGDATRTLVVGAHLDSVGAGAGISDNGSGSAMILELALQMKRLSRSPRHRVRFIWFGAEEMGLLGSHHYVNELTDEERDRIALMLNFDMLASPNYARFVSDGDGSSGGTPGPAGSDVIERMFREYFQQAGLTVETKPLADNSDYFPFAAAGIPVGFLSAGFGERKTPEQADSHGGVIGAPHDPCYHQACDALLQVLNEEQTALYAELAAAYPLIGNINLRALDELSAAAVQVIGQLAWQALPPGLDTGTGPAFGSPRVGVAPPDSACIDGRQRHHEPSPGGATGDRQGAWRGTRGRHGGRCVLGR